MTFAHLTLATCDVEATVEFFEKTLGWRRLVMPGNIDVEAVWLEVVPGQQVHVLGIEGFEVSPFEREYGRHVAFFHPADDWEPLKERLRAAGSEPIGPLRPTPFPRFFFKDPNGYLLEVVQQESFVVETPETSEGDVSSDKTSR